MKPLRFKNPHATTAPPMTKDLHRTTLKIPEVPAVPIHKLVQPTVTVDPQPLTPKGLVDAHGNPIGVDSSQYRVLETFMSGRHMCIIGSAGTGKTTVVQALSLLYHQTHPDSTTSYRKRGKGEYTYAPKMAIIAYTNRAANNMSAKLTAHPILGQAFGYNITTAHNLLEYTVEFTINPETGNNTCRYYPQRSALAPLDIDVLVVEEATMIGVGDKSIWAEIFDALPSHCQIVMLGDLNQLPPVIGKPVLSYAIQSDDYDTVELTHVYRQALDNPIIRQARRCLSGKPIETDLIEQPDGTVHGVKVFSGKTKIKLPWEEFEQKGIIPVLDHYHEHGQYDPMTDMVLSPYNKPSDKAITAQNIANAIASNLAKKDRRIVYEIRTGFNTLYLAKGDRVFYEKEEGIVTNITTNSSYMGKAPRPASIHLNYFGQYHDHHASEDEDALAFLNEATTDPDYSTVSIAKLLEDQEELKEERKRTASHTVEITRPDGTVISCSAVGEFGELQLGYALSVHKAQGSEWPNVFVALHDTNATLLFRELLYTAMTRAQKFTGIIAQPHILAKAQANQRIKGNTLEDKIEFFNGGYLNEVVPLNPADRTQDAVNGK